MDIQIRKSAKDLYVFIYNDPYNKLHKYFPAWEDLPETSKRWWDRQVIKIQEQSCKVNKEESNMGILNGKKTYTAVLAGLAIVVGTYFQGEIDIAAAVNQAVILLGIGGIRHGMSGK